MRRSSSGAALICASVAICLLLSVARAEEPLPPAGESNAFRLQSVLGRDVRNTDGDGGRVIDLLTDTQGRLRAAVIEFGGFLGLGTRKIAVEWQAFRFVRDGAHIAIIVDVTRDQLRAAPEYKPNEPPFVVKTLSN
jgi:hypothetical protein